MDLNDDLLAWGVVICLLFGILLGFVFSYWVMFDFFITCVLVLLFVKYIFHMMNINKEKGDVKK